MNSPSYIKKTFPRNKHFFHKSFSKFKNNKHFGLVGNKYFLVLQNCTSLNSPYVTKLNLDKTSLNGQQVLTPNYFNYKPVFNTNLFLKKMSFKLQALKIRNKIRHYYFLPKQPTIKPSKTVSPLYVTGVKSGQGDNYFDYQTYTYNFEPKFKGVQPIKKNTISIYRNILHWNNLNCRFRALTSPTGIRFIDPITPSSQYNPT
jgi:hypothetical protein